MMATQLQVAVTESVACVRVEGPANFAVSVHFKSVATQCCEAGGRAHTATGPEGVCGHWVQSPSQLEQLAGHGIARRSRLAGKGSLHDSRVTVLGAHLSVHHGAELEYCGAGPAGDTPCARGLPGPARLAVARDVAEVLAGVRGLAAGGRGADCAMDRAQPGAHATQT